MLGLITVISGMTGWLYEFIFYYFDSGMKALYWQGGNFLPWINIYAYGAVLIILLNRKNRKKPVKLALVSLLATGLLELGTGLILHRVFGIRFWNYDNEILNFGNIGGYVCLRSLLVFALMGLLLMYAVIPFCIFLSIRMNRKVFLILSIGLFAIVMADELYNLVFARILGTPAALEVYQVPGL